MVCACMCKWRKCNPFGVLCAVYVYMGLQYQWKVETQRLHKRQNVTKLQHRACVHTCPFSCRGVCSVVIANMVLVAYADKEIQDIEIDFIEYSALFLNVPVPKLRKEQ